MPTEHKDVVVVLDPEEAAVLRAALREYTLRLHGDVEQLRAAEPHPSSRIASLIDAHARAADVVDQLLERLAPAPTMR